MYSIRSLDTVGLVGAALLLAACQADSAANGTDAATIDREVVATAPANAAAPATPPPLSEPATARYRFTGTEPFWGGTIEGAAILYRTPEDQAGQSIAAAVSKEGAATRYSATLDGQPFILVLTPGTCSDGMSDTVYPLKAALTVQGEQRSGCASPLVGSS